MKGHLKKRFCKICGITAFSFFFCVSIVAARQYDVSLPELKDPADIGQWLSASVHYRMRLGGGVQLPGQTLELRAGDCEDMAMLVSAVLSKQKINNDIIVVSFRGIDVKHAICVWKGEDGRYYFSSNNRVHSAGYPDLKALLERHYPDWEKAAITDSNRNYIRVIRRT